jgi:hypothetical protein
MFLKLLLYINTIKYLKFIQIRYRIYYSLKRRLITKKSVKTKEHKLTGIKPIKLKQLIPNNDSHLGLFSFSFLNLEHEFKLKIDWNYSRYGKLWTYNLCYFDYLFQTGMSGKVGLDLMLNFAKDYNNISDGKEPYPCSIRLINWIKFVSTHHIDNKIINQIIFLDVQKIKNNLEYHLMGNHLLENGFALLYGAIYLNDINLYRKSSLLLTEQLQEQILEDGAHFELSPMYHQIILAKMLDCVNLLSSNKIKEVDDLLPFIHEKSQKMLGWILDITFKNGDIPNINDSSINIAASTEKIEAYGKSLSVFPIHNGFNESGYRKYNKGDFEMLVDVGNIGPDYIPGHAHCDTLSFLLYYKDQPLIIDTGTSTYEKNKVRQLERSTAAHNTVIVNNKEQSEVWDGFRVARRAKSTIIKEERDMIIASHDGYSRFGIIHQRSFSFSDKQIYIKDFVNKESKSEAFFHFHPQVKIKVENNSITGNFGSINFNGCTSIQLKIFKFAEAFNKTTDSQVVSVEFIQKLKTTINFE